MPIKTPKFKVVAYLHADFDVRRGSRTTQFNDLPVRHRQFNDVRRPDFSLQSLQTNHSLKSLRIYIFIRRAAAVL